MKELITMNTHMTRIHRFLRSLLVPAMILALAAPAFAQTATTQTTLSGAITAGQTTLVVASATGIAAGSELFFVDSNEALLVGSISGTTVTATQRGVDGTAASSHPTGTIIFASTGGTSSSTPFVHGPPYRSPGGNVCVRTQQALLPLIDVDTGNVWDCTQDITAISSINGNPSTLGTNVAASNLSRWRGSNLNSFDQSVVPRVPVVNVGYTIKAWDYIVAVTSLTGGTNGGQQLTLPSATGLNGKTFIIMDEGGFFSNSVVMTVIGTINGATNLALNSAYTSVRLYSNGVSYFKSW